MDERRCVGSSGLNVTALLVGDFNAASIGIVRRDRRGKRDRELEVLED